MPKRSNPFQRVIEALYAAIRPAGGKVTESAELLEPTSGARREVDILAETSAYGARICIAIEVRGRSKKDEIQWIDALVGKYRDLPVNKVIAVSASGFSQAAAAKARSANIDLLPATEIPHHDWPDEFQRLGLVSLVRSDRIDVSLSTSPSGAAFTPASPLSVDGVAAGTVRDLVDALGVRHRAWLTEYLRTHFLDHFKTAADLKKTLFIEVPAHIRAPYHIGLEGGSQVELTGVVVRSHTTCVAKKVSLRHTTVDSHLVSSGQVSVAEGTSVELHATQSRAHGDRITVRLRPLQSTSKKPKTEASKPRPAKPGRAARTKNPG